MLFINSLNEISRSDPALVGTEGLHAEPLLLFANFENWYEFYSLQQLGWTNMHTGR